MTRRVRTMSDPSILAVADAPGAGEGRLSFWRLGADGPRLDRIVTGAAGMISSAIGESNAGRVIFVIPSGHVRCRVCDLPDAAPEQLAMALRLQAESAQLGSIPAHRSATAVFPKRPGTTRCGIIVEWPTTEPAPTIPLGLASQRSLSFAGDVSALAGLAAVAETRGPLLFIDEVQGMIAFAMETPKGLALRAAREDLTQDAAGVVTRLLLETALHAGMDGPALERVVTSAREAIEAAAATGFGCTADDRMRLAQAVGAPTDPQWWRTNALHAGAALLPNGPLATLAGLHAHVPGEEPDLLGRLINRVASPEGLGWAVVAAVIAIAFGPLAIAWTDYRIMRWKVGDIGVEKLQAVVAENDKMLALYREKSQRTWPISKILGDLAVCTPEGIDFEQINIVHGESVSIRGQARRNDQLSAPEVILRMESLLRDSRIFSKINKGWEQPNQMGISQFNLSANISSPTRPITPMEGQDWAKVTLAERKYPSLRRSSDSTAVPANATTPPTGTASARASAAHPEAAIDPVSAAGAAPSARGPQQAAASPARIGVGGTAVDAAAHAASAPASGEKTDAGATAVAGNGETAKTEVQGERRSTAGAGSEVARRGLQMTGEAGSTNERTGRSGPAAVNPDVPPAPLSDDQINAMSKEEALAGASAVAKARNNKAFDEATQTRLKEEFYKLMARVRASQ